MVEEKGERHKNDIAIPFARQNCSSEVESDGVVAILLFCYLRQIVVLYGLNYR